MNYSEATPHHYFTIDFWRDEVRAKDTQLGYGEWVEHRIEETENDLEHLDFGDEENLELLQRLHPPLEIGCHFDGVHGYDTNAQRVIDLAIAYGWQQPPAGDEPGIDADEILSEDEQDATRHLEQFAPEGHYVGWHEGDFGAWPADEDEEPEQDQGLGEPRTCRELQGPNYDLIQNEQDLAAVMEDIDWLRVAKHSFVEKNDVTGAIVAVSEGEYAEIWGCVQASPYVLTAIYYRLQ